MNIEKPNRAKLASLFQRVAKTQEGFSAALAKQTGDTVFRQTVQQWLKRENVPAQWVGVICAASNGRIASHELRPDLFPAPE